MPVYHKSIRCNTNLLEDRYMNMQPSITLLIFLNRIWLAWSSWATAGTRIRHTTLQPRPYTASLHSPTKWEWFYALVGGVNSIAPPHSCQQCQSFCTVHDIAAEILVGWTRVVQCTRVGVWSPSEDGRQGRRRICRHPKVEQKRRETCILIKTEAPWQFRQSSDGATFFPQGTNHLSMVFTYSYFKKSLVST